VTRSTLAFAVVAALGTPSLLQAQIVPPGSSWIEAGGFYQHVSHDFGSWTGGYARLVLAGSRDVWYADAKLQEAFRDRGAYGALANVHHFGSRLFSQVGVGAGTGKYVLPKLRADAALTLKLGNAHALLLTAGGTYVKSKSIYSDQALFGSVAWYAGPYALLEAGAVPFGLTAIDLARTEVGLIIIAVDYDPGERSPWDLSMDRFIRTDTECVGAAALRERGERPPKRFKTLRIEGEAAPDYGATVTKDGREVGVVTSPASSPRVGTIGLAVLDTDIATDGEKVEVAVGDGTAPATVGPLSILDPQKRRPRD